MIKQGVVKLNKTPSSESGKPSTKYKNGEALAKGETSFNKLAVEKAMDSLVDKEIKLDS